jgi:hypothetical protein
MAGLDRTGKTEGKPRGVLVGRFRFRPLASVVFISAGCLVLSLGLVHFAASHVLSGQRAPFPFFGPDLTTPQLTVIVSATILLYAALAVFILRLLTHRPSWLQLPVTRRSEGKPAVSSSGDSNREPSEERRSGQILKLVRNAERLNAVEQDLIRKLGQSHRADRATEKLLCEMQICTCRMMAQLADIDRMTSKEAAVDQSCESETQAAV